MLSKCAPEAKDVSIDRIVEIAQQRMPGNNLTVWFPRIPNGVYLVTANNERGPQVNEMLFIDRASGEILEDRYNSQTKVMYQLGTWNYPLHVGTIWGMPSKIPLAGDLYHSHDVARDWHLDVVGTSPDGQARSASPRERSPPPLAGRHCHSDQYFATGARSLGGVVAGRRAARGAIAEKVSFTANTVSAFGCSSSWKAETVPEIGRFSTCLATRLS
jgi:hypothetical protein